MLYPPKIGRMPRFTPKIAISTIPNQNVGREPISATDNMSGTSLLFLRKRTESDPNSDPNISESTVLDSDSNTVHGKALARIDVIGILLENDVPKSQVKSDTRYAPNC